MKFSNDGLTLWYGSEDTPSPGNLEPNLQGASVTIAVHPANVSNRAIIKYCVDRGVVQTIAATLSYTDYARGVQYFRATFPEFYGGENVEYIPVLFCAGRQVPDVLSAQRFTSTFCLGAREPSKVLPPQQADAISTVEGQPQSLERFPLHLDYLCTVSAQLNGNPEVIGETPEGLRVNWYLAGGVVAGPKLNARIRPGGGDWMTIRPDGIGVLEIRATFETDDGALIDMHTSGVYELGEDGYQNFLDCKWPNTPMVRTAPQFLTADPRYKWLNRLQCFGVGEVRMSEFLVIYDLYLP